MKSINRNVELQGIRFVQGIVEDQGSAFQEFAAKNDIGNDCHIEFRNGFTGCYAVYAQIKSGDSYKDTNGYKIPALRRHLTYWSNALYQIIGIVYDTKLRCAFWVDISSYIDEHPEILSQRTHKIRVSPMNVFSEETFPEFVLYCLRHREKYKANEKHLKSLELFASIEPESCYEVFKALVSNYSNRPSTWMYIISNFGRIREEGIRRNILGIISNYLDTPNVFGRETSHSKNPKEDDAIREIITDALERSIHVWEVRLMIPYMRGGIYRGTYSYRVFRIFATIAGIDDILKSLCFSGELDPDDRNFCFWLYLNIVKFSSIKDALVTAADYLSKYPDAREDDAIVGVVQSIKNGELWPVG